MKTSIESFMKLDEFVMSDIGIKEKFSDWVRQIMDTMGLNLKYEL